MATSPQPKKFQAAVRKDRDGELVLSQMVPNVLLTLSSRQSVRQSPRGKIKSVGIMFPAWPCPRCLFLRSNPGRQTVCEKI